MYELLILLGFAGLAYKNLQPHDDEIANASRRITEKVGGLWDIAHSSMKENRFLRAEKALLTILKIDEKNAAAYNRLGILYAKQKEYRDAIDCFEIASSIEASASSLHNLGLIYYETENYQKAAIAFEQAIKLESDLAARHIAYAKVQEKLGNNKMFIYELETAAKIEPNRESYKLLISAYGKLGMQDKIDILNDKLKRMQKTKVKPKRIIKPKRRVII